MLAQTESRNLEKMVLDFSFKSLTETSGYWHFSTPVSSPSLQLYRIHVTAILLILVAILASGYPSLLTVTPLAESSPTHVFIDAARRDFSGALRARYLTVGGHGFSARYDDFDF